MTKTLFNCKMEEVPVLAGFVVDSLQEDLADFNEYFSDYTSEKVNALLAKRNYCMELEKSSSVVQQLKSVTAQLADKEKGLRPDLNKLEGYLKRAEGNLDIPINGFSLKAVRDAISRGNDEGIIAQMQTLLANIGRNQSALEAAGMKPELLAKLTEATAEIDRLNNEQNKLENNRGSAVATSIKDYNEL